MRRYNPKEIEPKWQAEWEKSGIYKASDDSDKPKKYILEYFPYPSGAAMHVGHVRNYTIGDAVARFNRMRGYNVLHPMGWDAFGLPAENYAIKNKISPKVAIKQNTDKFKQQLMQMGFSYDWSREINSSDPSYYKWTQWFFLLLHKKGLAYQKESLQWWCPFDKTVLANEQVEAGRCWRCGNEVEKKALKQWFFKITDYADRLESDLEDLNWSESIKSMQRNWIGRSKGAEIDFALHKVCNPNPELARTYIMGQKNINKDDIKSIGGSIEKVTDNGHLCVEFPASKASKFEKIINEKMEPGFWNEYLTNDEVVFIFKHKDGTIKRYTLNDDNAHEICVLGNTFNNQPAPKPNETAWQWLENNSWYAPIVPKIKVFTTRPDTLFGATFMVLSPEHPLTLQIANKLQFDSVQDYVKKAQAKSDIERQETDREKTGVFTGAYAINPVNNEKIPVWVADYVLMGYGTGAIMAVPAHDERDYEFAKKFGLDVVEVIEKPMNFKGCYAGEGMMINSGPYNVMRSAEAREKIVADMQQKGLAKEKVNYRIRDWLISRQRYWGAPIPMIHCKKCGTVPVPEDQLPVELPDLKSFEPSGDGRSPLANVQEFVNTKCPKCEGPAERETDTMDGFACSSWYFLRFADPHNANAAFSKDKADFWLPVDDYIGGAEHAVMHLLYARFWTKVMFDEGMINFSEPFSTLRNQGMILAPDGQKMSKSKGNTIEPDGLIEQGYGADSTRIMELFIGPWNQSAAWSVEGMGGSFRFLQRAWTLVQEYKAAKPGLKTDTDLLTVTHKAIEKVSRDLEELGFNTAIAALMEMVNELYKIKAAKGFDAKEWEFTLVTLTQLLAPFAPHISEELWLELGQKGSVHTSNWPVHDEKYLQSNTINIVVQVNGKVRDNIVLASDSDEEAVIKAALQSEKVKVNIEGKKIVKTIYVPGKLVNLVVK